MKGLNVIQNATGLSLTNSTITSTIAFFDSSNLRLDSNTISTSAAAGDSSAVIYVAGGQNNVITNNTLDGGYHGSDQTGQGHDARPTDVDDGIVIIDATGDTISGNTISNVYDAGIEGVNGVRSSTITNNMISNALFAGISSYHCTAWEGNTITGNAVTQSEAVMLFLWETDALCDTARNPPTSPSFSNNTMSNNTFTSPVGQYYAVYITFDKGASVSGNLFSNNRIQGSVVLSPLGGFTVGDGNACSSGGDVHC
jgi:parallel beta-helix repeat protein